MTRGVTHSVFIPADFRLGPQHSFAYNSAGFLRKRKPFWTGRPTIKMRSGAVRTDCGGVRYEEYQQFLLIPSKMEFLSLEFLSLYCLCSQQNYEVYLKMCINNINVNMHHLAACFLPLF